MVELKQGAPTLFTDVNGTSIELGHDRHYILKEIITYRRGHAKGRLVVDRRLVDVDIDHFATTDYSAN